MTDIFLETIKCNENLVDIFVDDDGHLVFQGYDIELDLIAEEMGFHKSRCLEYYEEWKNKPVNMLMQIYDFEPSILLDVAVDWAKGANIFRSRYASLEFLGPLQKRSIRILQLAEDVNNGVNVKLYEVAQAKREVDGILRELQQIHDHAPPWIVDEFEAFEHLMVLAIDNCNEQGSLGFSYNVNRSIKIMDWCLFESDSEWGEDNDKPKLAEVRGRERIRVMLERLEEAGLRKRT